MKERGEEEAPARESKEGPILPRVIIRLSSSEDLPDLSCLMRPLLLVVLTGRKSLNHEMSGSGLPLAAHSMVAVRVRSTTFSCGPMSMVGKPGGSWSSVDGCETHGREVTQLAAGTAGRSECVYFVSVLIFCFFLPCLSLANTIANSVVNGPSVQIFVSAHLFLMTEDRQ